uniref:chemerin-like receptor 1 n=1 Tax=Pristiophorus japonicus TaxID=55135 RepID=UPI00398ED6FB
MEPENLQLTNSSEVPPDSLSTEGYSSFWRGMCNFTMAIYAIVCILRVSGNGLVIWATGFKLKRTSYTVWLLSLAVADFTVSLLLPLFIADIALNLHWPFGQLLCKFYFGMEMLFMHASIWTLVAISVDHCVSVVLPIWSRTHRSPRLAALLSLGVWVVAAIFSAPAFASRQFVSQSKWMQCSTDYLLMVEWNTTDYGDEHIWVVIEQAMGPYHGQDRAMPLALFLLGFLLPFLVIAASCATILLRLRWGRLAPSGGKPFKVTAAIILAFLLRWASYHVVSILLLLQPHGQPWSRTPSVGLLLSYSLAYFDSCINPVLYIFTWQDFRDLLKKSLQRVNNQGESMQSQFLEGFEGI